MDWLQSIQGILTMTFGGISIVSITSNIISLLRNGKAINQMNINSKALSKSNDIITELNKKVEDKNNELEIKEKESEYKDKVIETIMETLSVVIVSSIGIDQVTKLEIVNKLKNVTKTKIEISEAINKKFEKFKELNKDVQEISEDLEKGLIEESNKILEEASEFTNKVINKYANK